MSLCFSLGVMPNSFAIPWTVAHQAPRSMGFPRQEYWSGLLFPSSGDLPNPGIECASPASAELAGRFFTIEPQRRLPPLFLDTYLAIPGLS